MKSYEVKHKGVEIELGGEIYVVPPLNFISIERFEERLENIQSLSMMKQISLMIDIIHCALLRNYPDLTRDDVGSLLDVSNIHGVYHAVMFDSGLVGTPEEAGKNEDGTVKK